MPILSSLKAWTLAASLAFAHHAEPKNPVPRPMSEGLAEAIASEAIANPLFAGVDGPQQTAALLVVFGFRESSYRSSAVGDGGRSCGVFQTPCKETPLGDVNRQARIAIRIMKRSIEAIPEHPLALYCGGSLERGSSLGDLRLIAAHELISEVPLIEGEDEQ